MRVRLPVGCAASRASTSGSMDTTIVIEIRCYPNISQSDSIYAMSYPYTIRLTALTPIACSVFTPMPVVAKSPPILAKLGRDGYDE